MKGLLGDTEKVTHLLDDNCVFVLGEIVFKSHEMGGFLKAEAKFLSNQQEIVIVDFLVFGLLHHGLQKLCLDSLIFEILSKGTRTLLSLIQTSFFAVIKII